MGLGASRRGGALLVACCVSVFLLLCVTQSRAARVPLRGGGSRLASAADGDLLHVSVVTRHGDRTPLSEIAADPIQWDCSQNTLSLEQSQAVLPPQWRPSRMFRREYLTTGDTLRGNCSAGQLTVLGFQQQVELGQRLRARYQGTLFGGQSPPRYSPSTVYVRTTLVPRTQASAQGLLQGLFPEETNNRTASGADTPVQVIPMHTLDSGAEYMHINPSFCPRVAELVALMFAENSPSRNQLLEIMAPYVAQIMKVFDSLDPFAGLTNYDSIKCRYCHQRPLPPGYTEELNTVLTKAFNLFNTMQYNATYWTLAPFYGDLLRGLDDVVAGDSTLKFSLYSGHDTTVGPLLVALQAFDGIWPHYASNVEFELWSDSKAGFLVHVMYNLEDLALPGCGNTSWCTLDQLHRVLEASMPANLKEECKIKNPLQPL